MARIGIIGGSGYTASELIRLLSLHPEAEIAFVISQRFAGQKIRTVHDDTAIPDDWTFTEKPETADVVFLCLPHGKSREYLNSHPELWECNLIDMSQDFRYRDDRFQYGLPELYRTSLRETRYIANPGCFATAIQLALLPFIVHQKLASPVHITGITGSTGAGNSLQETTHFTWRTGNISTYKVFSHQHLYEIQQTIQRNQPNEVKINFVPFRGPFTRGIFISLYFESTLTEDEVKAIVKKCYTNEPFIKISDKPVHLKQVINTNYAAIFTSVLNGKVYVECVIDNLIKGASGQAIQNMNLMLGLKETAGLLLKPVAF